MGDVQIDRGVHLDTKNFGKQLEKILGFLEKKSLGFHACYGNLIRGPIVRVFKFGDNHIMSKEMRS